jgi:hypothetical protein
VHDFVAALGALDKSRPGSRNCFAKSRSSASLAWFSDAGAATETLSLPAATPSIRSARARGVSRTARRTPLSLTLRGDSKQEGSEVLVNQYSHEIEKQN